MPINPKSVKKTAKPLKASVRSIITNPTGLGSAYVYSRSKIKKQLDSEYIQLLQRYRRQFSASVIIYPDRRQLWWIKVPSSDYKHNKIIYDILIEIPYDPNKRPALRDARFFSNNMSFVFTYAYMFFHSDLMIDRFADLLPSKSITQYPSVRNPVLSNGFERSLYFACHYLLDSMCLSPLFIERHKILARPGIDYEIKRQITSVDKLIAIYQHTKSLKVKNPRKPVDQTRRAEREKLKNEYVRERKQNRKSTYIKQTRGKLSARKARRIIGEI